MIFKWRWYEIIPEYELIFLENAAESRVLPIFAFEKGGILYVFTGELSLFAKA
jgi:hypothetical protein